MKEGKTNTKRFTNTSANTNRRTNTREPAVGESARREGAPNDRPKRRQTDLMLAQFVVLQICNLQFAICGSPEFKGGALSKNIEIVLLVLVEDWKMMDSPPSLMFPGQDQCSRLT